MKKIRKGFTLIELLVVIAIIALLSTLAVVALNNARQKSRDAKRVSDVKQVQTALELYFADQQAYPAGTTLQLGSADAKCLSTGGFAATCSGTTTYMGQVPSDADPYYVYASDGTDTYSITFTLEGQTGSLAVGAHTATQNGIQ
ncbi:MAG: prepilin-type N-terminal cleavage/methylation domain-containing protein [Patescibacteria group bacterium]|jgi:general secretion pathway protein G